MATRVNDLTGKRFGMLVVIARVDNNKWGKARFLCKCDCGNEHVVVGSDLSCGDTKSCGCRKLIPPSELNLSGQKFGMLTVIKRGENDNRNRIRFICKCDCGNEALITLYKLRSGGIKSCGCKRLKHGDTGSNLYTVWHNLKVRCNNKKDANYHNYGGRGISVCDEWNDSYEPFQKWALANGYKKGLDLDRINNNGNYEPSNCRFVTRTINSNNRRSNHLLYAFGEKKTIKDWSRDKRCVVKHSTLLNRIFTCKWGDEKAITTPARKIEIII